MRHAEKKLLRLLCQRNRNAQRRVSQRILPDEGNQRLRDRQIVKVQYRNRAPGTVQIVVKRSDRNTGIVFHRQIRKNTEKDSLRRLLFHPLPHRPCGKNRGGRRCDDIGIRAVNSPLKTCLAAFIQWFHWFHFCSFFGKRESVSLPLNHHRAVVGGIAGGVIGQNGKFPHTVRVRGIHKDSNSLPAVVQILRQIVLGVRAVEVFPW